MSARKWMCVIAVAAFSGCVAEPRTNGSAGKYGDLGEGMVTHAFGFEYYIVDGIPAKAAMGCTATDFCAADAWVTVSIGTLDTFGRRGAGEPAAGDYTIAEASLLAANVNERVDVVVTVDPPMLPRWQRMTHSSPVHLTATFSERLFAEVNPVDGFRSQWLRQAFRWTDAAANATMIVGSMPVRSNVPVALAMACPSTAPACTYRVTIEADSADVIAKMETSAGAPVETRAATNGKHQATYAVDVERLALTLRAEEGKTAEIRFIATAGAEADFAHARAIEGGGEENTDDLCGDAKDNDGDGFTDCDDFDCSRNPDVATCSDQPLLAR